MLLTFALQGADAYRIDGEGAQWTLEEAIEEESHNVASEANADHLAAPTDEEYEAFRQRVVRDATLALRGPGDEYRDPIGVLWMLIDDKE